MKNFIDNTEGMSPEERGEKLLQDNDLMLAHAEAAKMGQTRNDNEENTDHYHIVTFVHVSLTGTSRRTLNCSTMQCYQT